MGNNTSLNKINKNIIYEDVQNAIKYNNFILINTLNENNQRCLIQKTIHFEKEEEIINDLLTNNININIIIYGENCQDESPNKKYDQLRNLGFTNVFIYRGGLFEWLLLQDIYGFELFETTYVEKDHLLYKGKSQLLNNMIEYKV